MLVETPTSIVACKEINEAIRDRRSLLSSLIYALMGPIIVGFLTFSGSSSNLTAEPHTLLALSSLFVLLSTFTGGMNIAMDTLAGERERRSLLPLLMNPVARLQIVAGKWISISAFSVTALLLNLAAFAIVIGHVLPTRFAELATSPFIARLLLAMIPLALLAGAAELAISTICRSVKEAHTWLAFLVFVPMALGMFLAFHPNSLGEWIFAVPVIGQQVLLSNLVVGKLPALSHVFVLCTVSLMGTLSLLRVTSKILKRDDVLYGN
jgi:sodium transport system permease protein